MEILIAKTQIKKEDMMLVFLLYFIIVLVSLTLMFSVLTLFSTLKIEISNMLIDTTKKENNNNELVLKISLNIGRIKWLKIKLNKNKILNIYNKIKLNSIKDKQKRILKNKIKISNIIKNKNIIKEIKKIKINLEELNLKAAIGSEDCILTSYLVATIAIIISNILPHFNNVKHEKVKEIMEKYRYKIEPIYIKKNVAKLKLNCIINTKMGHIIYIIYLIKRSDKDERTSYRKSYEYSYE